MVARTERNLIRSHFLKEQYILYGRPSADFLLCLIRQNWVYDCHWTELGCRFMIISRLESHFSCTQGIVSWCWQGTVVCDSGYEWKVSLLRDKQSVCLTQEPGSLWTSLSSSNRFPLARNSNVFFLLVSNAKGLRQRLTGSTWPIRWNLKVKAQLWCLRW